jgi:hypothetical protein
MIAAGVNAKSLQEFLGHASITITLGERAEEDARSGELSIAGA